MKRTELIQWIRNNDDGLYAEVNLSFLSDEELLKLKGLIEQDKEQAINK